jgi:hypothetical protein
MVRVCLDLCTVKLRLFDNLFELHIMLKNRLWKVDIVLRGHALQQFDRLLVYLEGLCRNSVKVTKSLLESLPLSQHYCQFFHYWSTSMRMIIFNAGSAAKVYLILIGAFFRETNVLGFLYLACPAWWEALYLGLCKHSCSHFYLIILGPTIEIFIILCTQLTE